GVGDRPGGHADSAAGEQGAQHRPGVVLGAAAVELDVDVLVGHGPHSFVSSSFAGPAMILMASFGTGATLCCASPAGGEAGKRLRHVRGGRRDADPGIGVQNQRHGLVALRPRPPVPGGAPANAFHTFWCPPRRKVSCRRNLAGAFAVNVLPHSVRGRSSGERRLRDVLTIAKMHGETIAYYESSVDQHQNETHGPNGNYPKDRTKTAEAWVNARTAAQAAAVA